MASLKVMAGESCYGRVSGTNHEAYSKAQKIIDMHKNGVGDKNSSSGSSQASYRIVEDAQDYPRKF